MSADKCTKRIYSGRGRSHQCTRDAKPGTAFCAQHSPEATDARRTKSAARYDVLSKARSIGWAIDAAREKAWNTLTVDSTDTQILNVVRAALQKVAALEASK